MDCREFHHERKLQVSSIDLIGENAPEAANLRWTFCYFLFCCLLACLFVCLLFVCCLFVVSLFLWFFVFAITRAIIYSLDEDDTTRNTMLCDSEVIRTNG
jgi:hypothetical protein